MSHSPQAPLTWEQKRDAVIAKEPTAYFNKLARAIFCYGSDSNIVRLSENCISEPAAWAWACAYARLFPPATVSIPSVDWGDDVQVVRAVYPDIYCVCKLTKEMSVNKQSNGLRTNLYCAVLELPYAPPARLKRVELAECWEVSRDQAIDAAWKELRQQPEVQAFERKWNPKYQGGTNAPTGQSVEGSSVNIPSGDDGTVFHLSQAEVAERGESEKWWAEYALRSASHQDSQLDGWSPHVAGSLKGRAAPVNIHGEELPEGYRFTEDDEKRLDAMDFYAHRSEEVELPPCNETEADRFIAWRWYGLFLSPMRGEFLKAMASRISRERQLLSEIALRQQAERERDEVTLRTMCVHCGWISDLLPSKDDRWPALLEHRKTCEKAQIEWAQLPEYLQKYLIRTWDERAAAEQALAASPALTGLRAALEAVQGRFNADHIACLERMKRRGYEFVGSDYEAMAYEDAEQAIQRLIDAEAAVAAIMEKLR